MTDWLFAALMLGLIVLLGLHVRSTITVYSRAAERRPRDVTGERREPPSSVGQVIGALVLLGFRRLGEVELSLPDTSLLDPLRRRRSPFTVWILVDSPATTTAEVVPMGPMISLETRLADDSIVQTTLPAGEDIDEPELRAVAVRGSPADAYDQHRLMVDVRAAQHGPPNGVHSMGEYLRNDADYRTRFARRYLRRPLIMYRLLPAGLVLAFAVVTLVAAVTRALGV